MKFSGILMKLHMKILKTLVIVRKHYKNIFHLILQLL